jgi:hypothetical protein
MDKHSRSIKAGALTLLILSGGAFAATSGASVTRTPIVSSVTTTHTKPSLCAGSDPDLAVELVPDAVVKEGKKERIEYHAEFTSHLEKPGALAWTATIVDDLGTSIITLGTGQHPIALKGALASATLAPKLADGDYLLRVRAAVATNDPSVAATAEAMQPFSIKNGVMSELSVDEWHLNTRMNQAIPIATPVNSASQPTPSAPSTGSTP